MKFGLKQYFDVFYRLKNQTSKKVKIACFSIVLLFFYCSLLCKIEKAIESPKMLRSSWNLARRCILMSSFHYKNKNCKKVKIAKFSIVLHFFYCSLIFKSIEQKKYWLGDLHTYKKVGLGHLEDIKKETIKKQSKLRKFLLFTKNPLFSPIVL